MEQERRELEEESIKKDIIQCTGGIIASSDDFTVQCLTVAGQVEGHTSLGPSIKTTRYEQLIPTLVAVEQSPEIDALLLVLNTVGGDVEAGLALAEMIASMKTPTASLVLGGGHSIGIPLAVSADISFIVKSATMTVHPVRTTGLVIGVEQSFSYFQKMQDRITDFITDHSGITVETWNSLLYRTDKIAADVGSILDGTEAVECGLIDSLGGLSDALSALKRMKG
ncbi:MAG: ATP-dependent Clp protease proteolytic subunit [Firmicutes bacterium]|nr:ATP-dependent Clp protease proteolytic subunit [Bacillota bacterium]